MDGANSMGIRPGPDGAFEVPAVETSQRVVLRFPVTGPELGSLALSTAGEESEEVVLDFRNLVQVVRFQLLDESQRPGAGERLLVAPLGEGLPGPLRGEFYAVSADEEGWLNLAFSLSYEQVRLARSVPPGGDWARAMEGAEVLTLARLLDSLVIPH